MNIQEKLHQEGYKIDFWYDKGKLDAVCIARRDCSGINLEKVYKADSIAEILFNDFKLNP